MIYIRNFNTHSEYEAAKNTLILPNVAACEDRPLDVHYNLEPPIEYDYVEIGGLKWATMNIGASGVTDYGLYFQWADAQGYTASQVGTSSTQKYFGWTDYKYSNSDGSVITKYNNTDGKGVITYSDDAASMNWGDGWRMPSILEYQALLSAVTTAWTSNYQSSGVKGVILTDKTDSSKKLFFPAAGNCEEGSIDRKNVIGYYWSNIYYSLNSKSARFFSFDSTYADVDNYIYRYLGFSIRAVKGDPIDYDYVEIGGKKWATMNIGASGVTDVGLYFQWGDTQGYTASQVGSGSGKKYFGWADYKYNDGSNTPSPNNMTKYNSTDGKTVLDISDDAARAYMGGDWRIPTHEDYLNLSAAVNTAWTESYQGSGVKGLVCTDKTDSSKKLFFPICGQAQSGSTNTAIYMSEYWSSTVVPNSQTRAFRICGILNNPTILWDGVQYRYIGYPIRGIKD